MRLVCKFALQREIIHAMLQLEPRAEDDLDRGEWFYKCARSTWLKYHEIAFIIPARSLTSTFRRSFWAFSSELSAPR